MVERTLDSSQIDQPTGGTSGIRARVQELCRFIGANPVLWRDFEMLVQRRYPLILAVALGIADDIATNKKVEIGSFSYGVADLMSQEFPRLTPLQRYHMPGALLGLWSGLRFSLLLQQQRLHEDGREKSLNWLDIAFPGIVNISYSLAEQYCIFSEKDGLLSLLQDRIQQKNDWAQELRRSILRASFATLVRGLALGFFLYDALDGNPTFSRVLSESEPESPPDDPRHTKVFQDIVNQRARSLEEIDAKTDAVHLQRAVEFFEKASGRLVRAEMDTVNTRQEVFAHLRNAVMAAITAGIAFAAEMPFGEFSTRPRRIYDFVHVREWALEYAKLYSLQTYGRFIEKQGVNRSLLLADAVKDNVALGLLGTEMLKVDGMLVPLAAPNTETAGEWFPQQWYEQLSTKEKQRLRRIIYHSPSTHFTGLLGDRLEAFLSRDLDFVGRVASDRTFGLEPIPPNEEEHRGRFMRYRRQLYGMAELLLGIVPDCTVGMVGGRKTTPGALYIESCIARYPSLDLKEKVSKIWRAIFEATERRPVVRLGQILDATGFDITLTKDLISWLQFNEVIKVTGSGGFEGSPGSGDDANSTLQINLHINDRQARNWLNTIFEFSHIYRSNAIEIEPYLITHLLEIYGNRGAGMSIARDVFAERMFRETKKNASMLVEFMRKTGLLLPDPGDGGATLLWTFGSYRTTRECQAMLSLGKAKRPNGVYLTAQEFDAVGSLYLKYGSPPVDNPSAWILDKFAPWNWPVGEKSVELMAADVEYLIGLACFLEGLLEIPDIDEGPVLESILEKVERVLSKRGATS